MHKSSMENMKKFVKKYLKDREDQDLKILDIGSQDVGNTDFDGSYRPLFNKLKWKYVGLDIETGKNVDLVVADLYKWKEIPSNSYDVVISGQALEHIEFPWLTVKEIARILKVGGICCLIAPSAGPEHKYPIDCWRFFPDGFSAFAKYANLSIEEVYNCWNDDPVNGEENTWKDTVMVCKKLREV